MKITCELVGRDGRRVTTTEVESSAFGLVSNNPFPASHLIGGVIWETDATASYMVDPAFGEA